MARVLVKTQPWGLLWNKEPDRAVKIPLTGAQASINTTVYSASTGSGTVTAFESNANGELPGYVEEGGPYTLTIGGVGVEVHAVGGPTVTALNDRQTKPPVAAGVVYVDPAGSDVNDGRSRGTAKATIGAGVSALPAGGGRVELASGTYSLSAAASVPNFVWVRGRGASTVIQVTGNNYAFAFAGNRACVSDVLVEKSGAAQTSGGAFDFSGAGSRIMVEHVYFGSGLHTTLNVSPTAAANTYIFRRLFWFGGTGHNTAIKIGGGTGLVTDVYLSDIVGTASTTADMGTWLTAPSNADTLKLSRVLFIKGGTGISLGATSEITNIKASDCTVDTMTSKGVDVGFVRVCELTALEVSTCGAANVPGLDIGANAKATKIRGGVVQGCGGYGVILRSGAVHTLIDGLDVIDNNTTNTGFNDGIAVSAGASSFKIVNCSIGNGVLGAAGNQKTGLSVASGASNNYVITGNHCFGNQTTNNVDDLGTGTSKLIAGNTPTAVPTVASAATVTLPAYSDLVTVSGTTTITGVTASWAGRRVTLIFSGALTFTDGANLKLNGNYVTTADDTITLVCDGTTWFEAARSAN